MKSRGNVKALFNTGRYETVLKQGERLRHLPWLVLLLTLVGSWQLWKSAEHHAVQTRQAEFDLRVQGAADRIKQRMLDYEQVLYGTRGFLIHQHAVEHREFRGYIGALQLARRFPGIQGVSYAPLVAARHKQAHIAAVRRDGIADYTLKPEGARAQYAPVAYIEPAVGNNQRVLGFDNFSSPQRKASLEQARDLDRAVLSEKLTLVQEDGQAPQPGCLMFLPVYKPGSAHATLAERRANIAGWLAASFRMPDLMAGMIAGDVGEFDIDIYDGTAAVRQSLLFDSDPANQGRASMFGQSIQLEIAGRPWRINASSLPAFESGVDKSKSYLTALAGVLLSIVLSGITALLVRERSRALQLAEGASSELRQNKAFQAALRENEQRWRLALEAAGHGVWDWDMQADRVTGSELSMQILGCTAANYPARFADWQVMIHPDDLPQALEANRLHMDGASSSCIVECRIRHQRSGEWRWIISRSMVVERDWQGKPLRMLGTHTDINERRAMQADMEEQKRFLDAIIDSLPGDFYMLDSNGKHIRWSKHTEEVTGYTAEEIPRLGAENFFEGADRAAIREEIKRVFETGAGEIEANLLLKNGDKIPYRFSSRRAIIGGQPYLVGVGFDISERRAMLSALEQEKQFSDEIINSLPGNFYMFDEIGRFIRWNKNLETVTGYTAEEISRIEPQDFFGGEERVAVQVKVQEIFARGAGEIEADLVLKSGKKIPYHFSARRTVIGGKPYLVGVGFDISARKAAEDALRESEERYREIFNDANFFIFTLDTAQRITFVPPVFSGLTGYAPEELIGEPISKLLTPQSLEKARQMIAAKLQGEARITQYEMEMLGRDGRVIPIEVNTSLLYKQGKVVGVQGVGRDITERHLQEQALRESEEKYRGLFENVGDLAYTSNLEGHFIMVNDALLEITGYTREELVGAHISKLLTQENLELAGKMTAAKLSGDRMVTRYELEISAKDGRQIPVEIVSTLVYKDGEPVRIQGMGRDISERKRAEDALQRSERKYRELMELATEAIFVTDAQLLHFVEVNRAACDLLGYARDELLAINVRDIYHPDDIKNAPIKFDEARAGQIVHTKRRFRRKDGSYVPVELSAHMLPDGRIQAVVRDISEWLAREEELQRSERNYRDLMEQSTEAIFLYDQTMHCVDVNKVAQEMFGFSHEEFMGMGMRDLVHRDDLVRLGTPEEQAKLKAMLRGELVIHGERRMRRKDGSFFPVQVSAKKLSDGRILSIKRDISEWLTREAALREANAKAEAASHAKSEFLANMSHEIRTPMNSVIGMARLALSRETDSRQLDYLEKILMSGEHLLGIIDDILDFSKIEAGKLQIESADFDLRNVMDNISSLMGGRAAAKGLEFVAEIDPELPERLLGDPLRLRQVLLIFADNAVKFTAQGKVSVSAKKVATGTAGYEVQFEVRDSGIGMNATELAMLFRPFQQTDGSVTRKYGGTGLGLSISKRLVELMGGEVGVMSEPGRGSLFWFRLKLDESRQEAATAAGRPIDRRNSREAIRNARILLAENNLFNQQVAREFLELAGCVVQVANNGEEALDLLQSEHFDCVLMDVQMPVLDGLEATRRIRANPHFASLPVIALTANALEEERRHCMEVGMNDFITKPVRPEVLYSALAKWLTRHTPPLATPERRKAHRQINPQQPAIMDFAVLAELVGGDRAKMQRLAYKFLETTRQDMGNLAAALERADAAQLKALGHHIKSPAAMMGAMAFSELCRALEINSGDPEKARELVRQMRELFAEIEEQVKAEFA